MRHWLLPLLFAPLLTACVNDGASYEISGAEHSLSLIREQPLFWDKTVKLSLAVARMPDCLRRHSIGPGTANTKVEIYRVPSGAFIVRAGKRMYATETQTCEGWAKMDGEPDDIEITLVGTFRVKNDKLIFVKEDDEEKKRR
ncbi:MAG: hypothetical protein L6Q55_03720 [Azonexus sp.]|nr:hypothetical protein [Azonexus sp.]MCK6411515.1 hypothetical protein [Azonexus sp.]